MTSMIHLIIPFVCITQIYILSWVASPILLLWKGLTELWMHYYHASGHYVQLYRLQLNNFEVKLSHYSLFL